MVNKSHRHQAWYSKPSRETTRTVMAPQRATESAPAPETEPQELARKLNSAAKHNDVAQVRAMLRAGAAVNATEMGSTALHALSNSGDVSLVSELCNVRADVDARDSQSTTPIILAAMKGHTDVVRMLLAETAQVDFRDTNGWTALRLAASMGPVSASHPVVRCITYLDVFKILVLTS